MDEDVAHNKSVASTELQEVLALALLDVPPGIDPTLYRNLTWLLEIPDSPPLFGFGTPQPIDRTATTTVLRVEGHPKLSGTISHETAPFAHLHGYRLEVVGLLIAPGVEAERVWDIELPKVGPIRLQAWLQRAYIGESDLYVELRWHPGVDEAIRSGGSSWPGTSKQRIATGRAIPLLRRIPHDWRIGKGRPDGSGVAFAGPIEYLESVARFIEWAARNKRPLHDPKTWPDDAIASRLGPRPDGISKSQMYAENRRAEIGLDDIRNSRINWTYVESRRASL